MSLKRRRCRDVCGVRHASNQILINLNVSIVRILTPLSDSCPACPRPLGHTPKMRGGAMACTQIGKFSLAKLTRLYCFHKTPCCFTVRVVRFLGPRVHIPLYAMSEAESCVARRLKEWSNPKRPRYTATFFLVRHRHGKLMVSKWPITVALISGANHAQ